MTRRASHHGDRSLIGIQMCIGIVSPMIHVIDGETARKPLKHRINGLPDGLIKSGILFTFILGCVAHKLFQQSML